MSLWRCACRLNAHTHPSCTSLQRCTCRLNAQSESSHQVKPPSQAVRCVQAEMEEERVIHRSCERLQRFACGAQLQICHLAKSSLQDEHCKLNRSGQAVHHAQAEMKEGRITTAAPAAAHHHRPRPTQTALDASDSGGACVVEVVHKARCSSLSVSSSYTTYVMLSGQRWHEVWACRKYGLKEPTPDCFVAVWDPVRTCRAATARSSAAGPLRGLRVVALNGIEMKRAARSTSNLQNSASS
mmetsp:Transcript_35770/g.113742  ORF Transcript_35770/g.113742 Transcript_35770/m.113742 type:complete len:241 (+) Transcript_35770:136-858(+)